MFVLIKYILMDLLIVDIFIVLIVFQIGPMKLIAVHCVKKNLILLKKSKVIINLILMLKTELLKMIKIILILLYLVS